jgi:hypothetical protein
MYTYIYAYVEMQHIYTYISIERHERQISGILNLNRINLGCMITTVEGLLSQLLSRHFS